MNPDVAELNLDSPRLKARIGKPQGREYYICKKVGKAIADYNLISHGDRIIVAVSGGKDSLCLLKILHDRLSYVPIKYSLLALHVDFGFHKTQTKKLIKYFESNGYEYRIEKSDILSKTPRLEINCFWCSWSRRKILFETARKLGIKKIALAHHKDDIIETTLLNFLFQGIISTMCVKQEFFSGERIIIRPFCYVQEKDIRDLAKELNLLWSECKCANSSSSKRAFVRGLIKEAEKISPNVKTNIFRSLSRIKKDYLF